MYVATLNPDALLPHTISCASALGCPLDYHQLGETLVARVNSIIAYPSGNIMLQLTVTLGPGAGCSLNLTCA
jgi:hypothetical protein